MNGGKINLSPSALTDGLTLIGLLMEGLMNLTLHRYKKNPI